MPVKIAFRHIFFRHKVKPVIIDGDSFHRYDRYEMREAVKLATAEDKNLSHFSPEANLLDQQEELFHQYSNTGAGRRRFYLHTEVQSEPYAQKPGTFTPWVEIPKDTDLLFYQGLHGAIVHGNIDISQYADLLIGVVPIINMEWIQKIHRDTAERDYTPEDVTEIILRRMPDYMRYITPQFSRTDINFQRVPTVDTSNPFAVRDVPLLDESFVVIRFRDPKKFDVDIPYLLRMIRGSFTSRRNTLVIPGGKMSFAMETLFTPILKDMIEQRRSLLSQQ
jgi:phosphoribulokinase